MRSPRRSRGGVDRLGVVVYGAVTLLAAADATGSPHKAAADGSIALASATGLVGHVRGSARPFMSGPTSCCGVGSLGGGLP